MSLTVCLELPVSAGPMAAFDLKYPVFLKVFIL
jgi:hypothetical protein